MKGFEIKKIVSLYTNSEIIKWKKINSKEYSLLFDYIKTNNFDSANNLKLLREERNLNNYIKDVLNRKKYNEFKNSVYQSLLNFMAFLRQKNGRQQLSVFLNNIQFLQDYNFFNLVETEIEKALEIAKKLELYEHQIIIQNYYSNLLFYKKYDISDVEKLNETNAQIIENIIDFNSLNILNLELDLVLKNDKNHRSKKLKSVISKIQNNPLVDKKDIAFRNKVKFKGILNIVNSFSGDIRTNILKELAYIELIESNESFIKEFPLTYILAISNFISILNESKINSSKYIEKLKKTYNQIKYLNSRSWIISLSVLYELEFLIDSGKLNQAIKLYNTNEKYFENTKDIEYKTIFYSLGCLIYFYLGKFKSSLLVNELFLNSKMYKYFRNDLRLSMLLIHSIIHYELYLEDNEKMPINYVKYIINKNYNQSKELYSIDNSVESYFLKIFKKILKLPNNNKNKIDYFKDLKVNINLYFSKNPEQRSFLNYFDIYSWIESHTSNNNIYTVYEKNNKVEDLFT